MKKRALVNPSILLLSAIVVILGGGMGAAFYALGAVGDDESFSGDRVLNTLFVIEDNGKPLCSYVLMYYPATGRAAVFDIPGSLGLILQRVNRVDRIDAVYDPHRIASFESEIEGLLAIEINFTMAVTIDSLIKMVDLIEGVDIFIPSPVDVYQGESILFPSGVTRLDGDKARLYVTYELPEENSDFPSFRRQRFFIGLLKRLGEQNEALKHPETARFYQSLIKTGMSQRTRARLFDELVNIDTDRMVIQPVGGNLRDVSGQTLVFPFWDGSLIKDIVRQTLGSMVRPTEGSLSERVFTVEVQNGTTVAGLAARTAELLRGFGYDIIAIGNADRGDIEKTYIINRSGLDDMARDFGDIIRCGDIRQDTLAEDGPEIEIQNFDYRADFTLVIGRDFNERYVTGN
jgi:anionic cell wall polymer biosynthesis LytR-Cps2A-Psr (LCP) family protein